MTDFVSNSNFPGADLNLTKYSTICYYNFSCIHLLRKKMRSRLVNIITRQKQGMVGSRSREIHSLVTSSQLLYNFLLVESVSQADKNQKFLLIHLPNLMCNLLPKGKLIWGGLDRKQLEQCECGCGRPSLLQKVKVKRG